ncbi:MAG: hypothetical protein HC836_07135 [Richelia sp. RM2_1_2]|nr:hypothetical protein [Richelia sp. SM2_1_7]NJM18678.1 hypothetical protein [Richelia sp. SM1_7_0]NJN06898.1 hypothetical protein [Richelia sp. RM1_1_1]NJO26175.1 hypothetical protein [Richelia sp. SL_2_1]NJO58129.1 hypothetical protein [Richelia sp. RM2_1_2]
MSKPIFELVDELPTSGLTVSVLNSLDAITPGHWKNTVGFVNTIKEVTGETDESLIQAIGERAIYLYNDRSQGYQKGLWLYQTVDSTDKALGAAALANKVSGKIPLFGGLINRFTPKADKAQTIDLSLKLIAELLAFCSINGIPGDSIGDFVASLGEYSGESYIRMVGLICLDGLIPLGPDFIQQAQSALNGMNPKELEDNSTFKQMDDAIPGNSSEGKLNFIGSSFDSVKGWMSNTVSSNNLTPQKITSQLSGFVDFADDKLDYLAAFIDLSTNYFEHTGTQTLAKRLIERAVAEI